MPRQTLWTCQFKHFCLTRPKTTSSMINNFSTFTFPRLLVLIQAVLQAAVQIISLDLLQALGNFGNWCWPIDSQKKTKANGRNFIQRAYQDRYLHKARCEASADFMETLAVMGKDSCSNKYEWTFLIKTFLFCSKVWFEWSKCGNFLSWKSEKTELKTVASIEI